MARAGYRHDVRATAAAFSSTKYHRRTASGVTVDGNFLTNCGTAFDIFNAPALSLVHTICDGIAQN
jgi:hypothetical protein